MNRSSDQVFHTFAVALLSMDKTEIQIEWTVNAGDQSSPWKLEIKSIEFRFTYDIY